MDQTQAASSPAEVEDVFQGQHVSLSEYSSYRDSGDVPERFKPAPTTDAPEQTVESEGDEPESASESESGEEAQEPPQKGSSAEKRIKQLLAEKKELQRKLEAVQQPTQADPSPARTEPAQQPAQQTRPKPTVDDKDKDGKPKYGTYEAYVEDLADWKAEQQLARFRQEQARETAARELQTKMDEARARYDDFDTVIKPAVKTIIEDQRIPPLIKQRLDRSGVSSDLLYVIGSDPAELSKFIETAKADPFKALDYIALTERAIREELEGGNEPVRGKAPEKKVTQAPKPPSPVGGGSSRAFDVSDESLSTEEWARKRTQDLKKRGKA